MADSATLQMFDSEETELSRQMEQHSAAIKQIQQRQEYLAELRRKLRDSKASSNGSPAATSGHLPRVGKAVRDFLNKHPGSTRKEILEGVAGRFRTTSKKPRDLLRTLLGQMIQRGRIVEDAHGNLKLPAE